MPAAELEGIKLPDSAHVTDGGAELVLNGAGVRTRFLFRVYVGALYVQKKPAQPMPSSMMPVPNA